ncbi:hypothetical protein BB561_004357 [Smittium simulii]|uniref:Elongator complex protein 4 n=1 Tax=Smittium simulii TaxID=133385 RepID=A0A2T9YGT6_9FUNG|nr:hypothetical protein BB561_004357 [Smittium simulii]
MSFRKAGQQQQPKLPQGTKYNANNSVLLVSTGISSLDEVLGGGVAVGTVVLVLEDRLTGYSKTVQSLFEAQSICSLQNLVVVRHALENKSVLAATLPGIYKPSSADKPSNTKNTAADQNMKIAWRYNKLGSFGDNNKHDPKEKQKEAIIDQTADQKNELNGVKREAEFNTVFDLTKSMDIGLVNSSDIECIDLQEVAKQCKDTKSTYASVFERISLSIEEGGYSSLQVAGKREVARVSIHNIGSPLWDVDCEESNGRDKELLNFFHSLRGLMRYSFGVCMVSLSPSLFTNHLTMGRLAILRKIEQLCDSVIELESFEGKHPVNNKLLSGILSTQRSSQEPPSEYHGMFYINKRPTINSLVPTFSAMILSGHGNLAFKLKRKKFSIETFHLPIEGGTKDRQIPQDSTTRPSKDSLEF